MREIHRNIVVALIFSKDGKLLMGRKDPSKGGVYPDCWHLPGGGVDEGESLGQAVSREIQEEVGMDAAAHKIIPLSFKNNGTSEKTLPSGEKVLCHMDFNYFEVHIDKPADEIDTRLNDDLVEVRWYSREELPFVKYIPGGKKFMQNMGYISEDVVPLDSRYTPLTQQKYCCVPTCIQMIMLRRGIPLVPAELIGSELGLVVPEDARGYFWNARTDPRPSAGYGTQIGEPEYSPNAAFGRLNIPLEMSLALISKFRAIDDFREHLSRVEADDGDFLVCFDWPTLFDSINKEHWGHVCVLDRVFVQKDEVRIIDPDINAPKWRVINVEELYRAMLAHGEKNMGGFWEIRAL